MQPDDKIIVLGKFDTFNGTAINGILRLNSNGTLDTSFNVGTGIPATSSTIPRLLKLKNNGKIVVVSNSISYNGATVRNIFVLNSNGSLDTTFNPTSTDVNGSIWSVELQSDDKIIIYLKNGTSSSSSSTTNSYIKRFNIDGSLDSSFTINSTIFLTNTVTGLFPISSVRNIYEIKQLNNGKILIGGDFKTVFGNNYGGIARLNANGSLDTTFTVGNGISSGVTADIFGTYSIYSIGIQSDNKILIGGCFPSYNGISRSDIARLNINGDIDTTFNPGAGCNSASPFKIKQLKVLLDNKILIAGYYDTYNSIVRKSIARLNGPIPVYPIIANSDSGTTTNSISSTPITNVRANDTYNSLPATSTNTTLTFTSSTNSGITLNTTTGAVSVASTVPVGTYTLTYQICAIDNPTNCATGTVTINVLSQIDAVNDSSTISSGITTTAVSNVLVNDFYLGITPTLSTVTLSLVSSSNAGVTLNATTGAVNVASTVPAGTYTLTYKICANGSTTACDTAIVTIVVATQINAVDDTAIATSGVASVAVANVRLNDTYNNVVATSTNTTLSLVSTSNSGITLNTTTGAVSVSSSVSVGAYTLTYKLCNGTNCDTAIVTITVFPTTPTAVNGIRANNTVQNIALQSNGKIIITGAFTTYNNISANRIARLNTDLTLDQSFTATGPTPDGYTPQDILIQPDDKILLVFYGSVTGFNGGSNGRGIIRLNANGTVDTTFNLGRSGLDLLGNNLTACAIQSDGKILIGGSWMSSFNGTQVKNMIRLNQDGSIDPSFDFAYTSITTTNSTSASIYKIVVQPDGRILVGGNKNAFSTGQFNVFRLNSNGSLDTTFTKGDTGANVSSSGITCTSCTSPIQNIILQPDNKIIVVGSFNTYNGSSLYKNIVKLNSDGSIDTSFNPSSTSDRVIYDAVTDSTGRIFIGGEFTTYNGSTVNKIVRLTAAGLIDASFNSGTGTAHTLSTTDFMYNNIQALKLQSDGKLIIGGNFTSYNGISATNVTRLVPTVAGGQGKSNSYDWQAEPEIDINKVVAFGDDKVSFYPNPSTSIFNIDIANNPNKYETIEVYTILGEKILSQTIADKTNLTIDLSQFADGYYIAKLIGEEKTVQLKLIKQ